MTRKTSKSIFSKLSIFCLGALLLGTTSCQDDPDPVIEITNVKVYASSNTTGTVGIYDVSDPAAITKTAFNSNAVDADGIYYDADTDMLFQVNRSANVVNAYKDVSMLSEGSSPAPSMTSTSDFINGRELAVSGDKLVVAQDADAANGNANKFYVYQIGVNSLTLLNTYTADINLWGIHLNGTTMYAIEDNSDRVAIYENFFANTDGIIATTKKISVEGIGRTHGLTYDADSDMMIMTDVGDAVSATDGAISVISDFTTKCAAGDIVLADQIVIEGAASKLGNPVDVAYDKENSQIYVAERKVDGGRILGFDMPTTSGDVAPAYDVLHDGASAVYLSTTVTVE